MTADKSGFFDSIRIESCVSNEIRDETDTLKFHEGDVKILRNILIVVVAVVALLFGLLFYSFWRAIPLKDGQPLSGGAVQLKDGIVSVGAIPVGDGQVILVDCGNDRDGTAILEGLKRMGYGKDAVRAILLTHAHSDHMGGCAAFPKAEAFAMAAEQPVLEGRAALRSPIGFLMGKKDSGIRPARYLQDGDTFPIGNVVVTAYLIPGHTDGSAAYLAAGTLYLGDSADAKKDGTLLPAKGFVSNDVEENHESLKKLAEKLEPQAGNIEFMEFAHSGPLRGIGPLLHFAKKTSAKP
jgi:glyoxylase-like metal-dependent hydrolase (beta-lactamase superfamily II)